MELGSNSDHVLWCGTYEGGGGGGAVSAQHLDVPRVLTYAERCLTFAVFSTMWGLIKSPLNRNVLLSSGEMDKWGNGVPVLCMKVCRLSSASPIPDPFPMHGG